jgi:hypothetical protein
VSDLVTAKHPAQPSPESPGARQRFSDLRNAVLRLHKTLVDSERVSYEKTIGAIRSPNHFLQLLTQDPWFAWLHPLSELIVSMDEVLDDQEPLTLATMEAWIKQIRLLMVPSEVGEGFSRHYFDAMQRDPDVVLAHGDVSRLVRPPKPPG